MAAGDGLLESLGVRFSSAVSQGDGELALLWEAAPRTFAHRFPQSGIQESYGDQWDGAPCLDFWVYVDTSSGRATISFEGWSGPDPSTDFTGDAGLDAETLRRLLADHLRLDLD